MSMDNFYQRSLAKVPADCNDPCFEFMPTGKNTLGRIMQSMTT